MSPTAATMKKNQCNQPCCSSSQPQPLPMPHQALNDAIMPLSFTAFPIVVAPSRSDSNNSSSSRSNSRRSRATTRSACHNLVLATAAMALTATLSSSTTMSRTLAHASSTTYDQQPQPQQRKTRQQHYLRHQQQNHQTQTRQQRQRRRQQQKEEEHTCPPNHSGWAPSSDCKSYFWCSDGSLSSLAYGCVDGLLFDQNQLTCVSKESVDCEGFHESLNPVAVVESEGEVTGNNDADADAAAASSTSQTAPDNNNNNNNSNNSNNNNNANNASPRSPPSPPTNRPTSLGPPIYFVDFPSQSCKTDNKPEWVAEIHMYSTKEECCLEMMDWIPLENCLGPNWIETNILLAPTGSPTDIPSASPSEAPTGSPSGSPSGAPSGRPSLGPTREPTREPTGGPTREPTGSPVESPSTPSPTFSSDGDEEEDVRDAEEEGGTMQANSSAAQTAANDAGYSASAAAAASIKDSYIVELLGWANADALSPSDGGGSNSDAYYSIYDNYQYQSRTKSPTHEPTKKPQEEGEETTSIQQVKQEYAVSELLLTVVADATVSAQRPDLNFGTHQALAVNSGRGSSGGEQFDSLLKFDVSFIDASRPIDSATLSIYVVESCDSGGTFTTTSHSLWDMTTVTWENAPSSDSSDSSKDDVVVIGTLGELTAGTWYDLDMTAALVRLSSSSSLGGEVLAQDFITIRIETEANNRCLYASMESGEALAPRMKVKYGQVIIEEETIQAQSSQQQEVVPEEPPVVVPPTPVAGDFTLLRATDDAVVVATNPLSNYGAEEKLLVAFDSSTRGIYDIILRFDLTEMQNTPPRSAVLSLYSESDCASAGTFSTTGGDNSDWKEGDVTWSTSPMYQPHNNGGGVMIGTFGALQANNWYGFNVVDALAAAVRAGNDDAVTFRLSSGNMNPCQYTSREGGRAPKLMVAY